MIAGLNSQRNRPRGRTTQSAVLLAALQGEAFGRELAQHDVQGRDDDERERDGDGKGADAGKGAGDAGQRRFDQMGDRRLADPAQRQRRDGDAELGGREVGVEIVERMLQRLGVHPLGGNQLHHPAAADGDEREFGGDEEAVGDDEDENGQQAAEVGHGLFSRMRVVTVLRALEGRRSRGPSCVPEPYLSRKDLSTRAVAALEEVETT